jgi:hypothetical protein
VYDNLLGFFLPSSRCLRKEIRFKSKKHELTFNGGIIFHKSQVNVVKKKIIS